MFETIEWDCLGDAEKYKKIVEKKRIYKFLLGLNKNLDEVHGRILGMKTLPKIREVVSEVRHEESRKKVMLGPSTNQPTTSESSALAARVSSQSFSDKPRKGRPWCDHCRRPGHTKETCWKIHGKPIDWKPARERETKGNHVAAEDTPTTSNSAPLSREQWELIQKLINQTQSITQTQANSSPSVIGTGSVAQKGNFLSALQVEKEKGPWIMDSGASDHMTGEITVFKQYTPYTGNFTVRIADGTLSKVA
ncbi:hypothetical protein TorRG33x02_327260, partial [Trema orientale]